MSTLSSTAVIDESSHLMNDHHIAKHLSSLQLAMETLPLEVLQIIYSKCDLVTVVRSRLTCHQWNRAARVFLMRLKVLYVVGKYKFDHFHAFKDFQQLVEPNEIETFRPSQCKIVRRRENLDIDNLIRFTAKYCDNIEVFVCEHLLPIELFADLLGHKMKYFTGRFTYNWYRKNYAILAKFPKLQKFPTNMGPCVTIQLRHKLPLKEITAPCYNMCECTTGLFKTTNLNESVFPAARKDKSKNSLIEPSDFLSIESLKLNYFNISENQTFCFPNLKQIHIHKRVYDFRHIRLSLINSPKLERICFEARALADVLVELTILCKSLNNLRSLDVSSWDKLQPPFEFIRTLTSSCQLMEELIMPFVELGPQEGKMLAKLLHLKKIIFYEISEEFVASFLDNLHPLAPKELKIINCYGPREITNSVLHHLIHVLQDSNRITKISISYYSSKCEKIDCLIRKVNRPIAETPPSASQAKCLPLSCPNVSSLFDEKPVMSDTE